MENTSERRLWIGNLDPRINEYQLLKLMQKHGNIEKFDLLFYRTGPLAGQPRGYAFVTFKQKDEAEIAKDALNNKLVGNKKIIVKWAHSINENNINKETPHLNIPVLAGPAKGVKRPNRESQIRAIEAKLKFMNRTSLSPEFEMKTPTTLVSKHFSSNKGETSHNKSKHQNSRKEIKRK